PPAPIRQAACLVFTGREVFFRAPFFSAAAFCLWNSAQRFMVAAMIPALPAWLILRRFGLAAGLSFADFDSSPCCVLAGAHRFFCAMEIRRLALALSVRFLGRSNGSWLVATAERMV